MKRLSGLTNTPIFVKFCLEYILGYCIWEDYQDADGSTKVYTAKELEYNFEFEGYGFGRFDPEIIAKKIQIYYKSTNLLWFLYGYQKVEIFGCRDDYAIRDFQYNGVYNCLMSFNPLPYKITKGCAVFDFEDGEIQMWQNEGKAFENQPTYGETRFTETNFMYPIGFNGKWWISSYDNRPYFGAQLGFRSLSDVGSLKSPPFIIDSAMVSFLIGGEYSTGQVGVEIRRYNTVVASYFVSLSRPFMKTVTLEIALTLLGSSFTLHLIDNSVDGYLMFDFFSLIKDSCSCDCCEKLGMEINSGSPYFIKSESITGFCGTNTTDNFPHNARFSQKLDDKIVFRCTRTVPTLNNFLTYPPWLSIKLQYLSVIDGWSYQGLFAAENCLVTSYSVMYAYRSSMWRAIISSSGQIIYYKNNREDGNQRQKLNPRIEAQYIRFIFFDAADNTKFCFRVEIIGCSKYSFNSLGQPILKKNFQTRNVKDDMNYHLKLIDVSDSQKSLSLSCLNEYEVTYAIQRQYQWWEIIYNSKVSLNNPFNKIILSLEKDFYKRTIQCFVFISNANNYTAMREFLIINEIERPSVVPFVTMDPGFEYRGGKLVSSIPSAFYTDSVNQAFVSLHLADIVHPSLIYPENQRFCPMLNSFFHPFENVKEYWGDKDDILDAFDQAIQDGQRSFYYNGSHLLAGKQTNVLAVIDNNNAECEKLLETKPQFLVKCESNCDVNPVEAKNKKIFKLIKSSYYKQIELLVKVNDVVIYGTTFFIKEYTNSLGAYRTESDFYETYFYESVKKLKETSYPKSNRYIYWNSVNRVPFDSPDLKDACLSLFTPYGSKPQGTGHFLTYLFMFPLVPCSTTRAKVYGKIYSAKVEDPFYFEQEYEIQHISKPIIILESNIGICRGEYREVVPIIQVNEVSFNGWDTFEYFWSWVQEESFYTEEKVNFIQSYYNTKEMFYVRKEKIIFVNASSIHTKTYQFSVKSIFGISSKKTRITVYDDYPQITWITPSPYIVIKDSSDILEIKTNNDNSVKEIKWYLNGTVIEESQMFTFLDYKNMAYQRKRLMLSNLNNAKMSGVYSVTLVSDYCTFKNIINVIVYENPTISLNKNFVSIMENSSLELKGTIFGGYPPIQSDDVSWKVNGNKVVNAKTSRLSWWVEKVSVKSLTSTLIVKDIKLSDGGQFAMEVLQGPSVFKVDAKVVVAIVQKNQTKVDKKGGKLTNGSKKHDFTLHSLKLGILVFFSLFLY